MTDSGNLLHSLPVCERKQNRTQQSPGSRLDKLGKNMQKYRIGSISVSHSLFSSYSAEKPGAGFIGPHAEMFVDAQVVADLEPPLENGAQQT